MWRKISNTFHPLSFSPLSYYTVEYSRAHTLKQEKHNDEDGMVVVFKWREHLRCRDRWSESRLVATEWSATLTSSSKNGTNPRTFLAIRHTEGDWQGEHMSHSGDVLSPPANNQRGRGGGEQERRGTESWYNIYAPYCGSCRNTNTVNVLNNSAKQRCAPHILEYLSLFKLL